MLHKFITSACTAAVIGGLALPAWSEDGDVVTIMLSTLYGSSGAERENDDLREFYARESYLPVWWQDGAWTQRAQDAVDVLGQADRFGLDATRYGSIQLDSAVEQGFATASGPDAIAATELALTTAVLAFVQDKKNGLVDPVSVNWHSRTAARSDADEELSLGLDNPDFSAWLLGMTPARHGYAPLLSALERYRAMAALPWQPIAEGQSIRAGDTDVRLPDLRERLVMLGDMKPLPASALLDVERFVYDDVTVTAVETFQRRHGLEVDGIVGSRTLAQLNVSPAERVATIIANLEKLRWMPAVDSDPERHVEINIPGFELVAYEGGKPQLNMSVIVGEPAHPTPLISDRIVNLKFAPNWTVPVKIARNELLPKIQADPMWLINNDYKVISDWGRGIEIDPLSVDWSRETARTWSYMLQQQPGPASALGLIRFSLTNPQDIYLHDTGSRNLFARAMRGLSHGCVRVADPVGLAAFVLEGESQKWSRERIEGEMNADETDFHRLEHSVPVDFFYVTAWVGTDGRMQFRRDLYGIDTNVLAAIEKASKPVIDLPLMIGAGEETTAEDVALSTAGSADLPL